MASKRRFQRSRLGSVGLISSGWFRRLGQPLLGFAQIGFQTVDHVSAPVFTPGDFEAVLQPRFVPLQPRLILPGILARGVLRLQPRVNIDAGGDGEDEEDGESFGHIGNGGKPIQQVRCRQNER